MTGAEPCFAPIEQILEPDTPLHPSVDLYALAGVARFWICGELPAPAFGAPSTVRRERLRIWCNACADWPHLHYSGSLLDALDSALSIYPAERPQSVAQMRARLDTASSTAGRPVSAAGPQPLSSNEATRSSLVPAPPPAARPAKCKNSMLWRSRRIPSPDNFRVAGIDDDPSVRTAFPHKAPKPRRMRCGARQYWCYWRCCLSACLSFTRNARFERGPMS